MPATQNTRSAPGENTTCAHVTPANTVAFLHTIPFQSNQAGGAQLHNTGYSNNKKTPKTSDLAV